MGSSNDGSPQASQGEDTEPAQRGFFGRLLEAFVPSGEQDGDGGEARPTSAGLQGLGALRKLRVDDVAVPKVEIVAVR